SAPLEPRVTAVTSAKKSFPGNGGVLFRTGTALARIPHPADIIFCPENYFAWLLAWDRPAQVVPHPPPVQHWPLVDCRPQFAGPPKISPGCAEQYNSLHFDGGNLVFADGHAKFRKFRTMRSGEFGLVPDEPYRVDQVQSFCNASGCGGTRYTAAF